MAREFDIPLYYRSKIVSTVKCARRISDQKKKDLSPSVLNVGSLRFHLARHFGFCFGVENAIEIAYRAVQENPGKRIFLLSEMIHNPHVNADLEKHGVRFLMKTDGTPLVDFDEITSDDVVVVPAFGTSLEIFQKLKERGIDVSPYNTTCPFVEKVWRRAAALGEKGFTIVIHGKRYHEETRATFSHARISGPSIVIRDLQEAKLLGEFILGKRSYTEFFQAFPDRCSEGFDPDSDLKRIGVVNQTTMLATETKEIGEYIREAVKGVYGEENIEHHFADTRDTLCYATSENQQATILLSKTPADLAIVVGGYNSSNTSHLVEILEEKVPTYFVKDADEILNQKNIRHLNLRSGTIQESKNWLPQNQKLVEILVTAGASCPDALVEDVIVRVAALNGVEQHFESAVAPYQDLLAS